jgi:polar amino acid transport system substrate-binding protein
MTSKNRPDISERISKALEKVKTTPYFKEIYHKWFE